MADAKLRTIGYLWLGGMAGAIAYNCSQPNVITNITKENIKTPQVQRAIRKILFARKLPEFITVVALTAAIAVKYRAWSTNSTNSEN